MTDGEREIIHEAERDARETEEGMTNECPLCDGTGAMSEEFECSLCDGLGAVPDNIATEFEESRCPKDDDGEPPDFDDEDFPEHPDDYPALDASEMFPW